MNRIARLMVSMPSAMPIPGWSQPFLKTNERFMAKFFARQRNIGL